MFGSLFGLTTLEDPLRSVQPSAGVSKFPNLVLKLTPTHKRLYDVATYYSLTAVTLRDPRFPAAGAQHVRLSHILLLLTAALYNFNVVLVKISKTILNLARVISKAVI